MKVTFIISVYPQGYSKHIKPLEVMTTDLVERVGIIVSFFHNQYSSFKKLHISVSIDYVDGLPF